MQTRTHSGDSSVSNSPSHGLRRSNLPAPLAPEVLTSSLPVPQRLGGPSSCPVNRSGRPAPDVPRMPPLSPAASPPAAQGRSPLLQQRESYQHRAQHGSRNRGGGTLSLPLSSTPTQTASVSVQESVDGNSRRVYHHTRSSVSSGSSGSGLERNNNALGLRTHELAPSVSSLSSRLPAVTQPHKLSTFATATSNVAMSQPPAQLQSQSASIATTPVVPTSPVRLVSQPEVTILTVSSPVRRCCLVADDTDRGVPIAPVSTAQIPLPPPPLQPVPATASHPSSTANVTCANNGGTSGSAHQREAAARVGVRDSSSGTEAYLHDNPRVRTLVNNLYQHVVTTQPEEPLQYLAQLGADSAARTPYTPLTTPVPQRGEARRPPGQQTRTVPQPRQLAGRGPGSAHPTNTHAATEARSSSMLMSAELYRDSTGTGDSGGGQTRARPVQPTPQQSVSVSSRGGENDLAGSSSNGTVSNGVGNRPSSQAARSDPATVVRLLRTPPSAPTASPQPRGGRSSASVGSPAAPQSIPGTVAHTIASGKVIVSGSVSSKHGSSQLLQRPGLVTSSLANSGVLSGGVGHQTGSSPALLQHSGGSGSAFRSSGGATQHSMASFAASVSGIERGEATPSDLSSLFSTNSVDLQEFIAEFRLAKEERYGGSVDHPTITLDELACIIESSSFTCADAEVLLDLFDELQPCARYLAGVRSPTRCSSAMSVTLKHNNSPPLVRSGLGAGSVNSVSSFNGTVTTTATAEGAATGKLRGAGVIHGSGVAAMHNNGNASGLAWPAGRVQGAESCVAAAHPPANIAAKNANRGQRRFADEAQYSDGVTHGGRADAMDSKALVIGNGMSGGAAHASPDEGGNYKPYRRCTPDAFEDVSPSQRQQVVSQLPNSDAADGEEAPTVPFDTLLARMAYKIQGRYPSEAIRIAFYGMVVDDESAAAALESSGRSTGFGADGASLVANGRSLRGVVSAESLTPSELTAMGSGSAGTATTGYGTLPSCTVPLTRCIAEGLFARLGMVDVTAGELQRGLRSAGLPIGQDEQRAWECHLEDFARLVRAITAVSERGSSVSPANILLTSLRESYLQRGSSSSFTIGNNTSGSGGTVPAASAPWKE
ncbi:hypothetical protein GH5_05818 [Leishmania sp. Ghana 2012 LV757]|uniref:hypothetical protein n=1 Tax=Leishmania sp. Ghana 2012 LV757 TaxID=2803181 RepID=UPI001B658B61|nr:hypothetical protein GH5_05818 [Leishmania sp. Ghana 2012 LV757]